MNQVMVSEIPYLLKVEKTIFFFIVHLLYFLFW
jgi:hypothetical protein